ARGGAGAGEVHQLVGSAIDERGQELLGEPEERRQAQHLGPLLGFQPPEETALEEEADLRFANVFGANLEDTRLGGANLYGIRGLPSAVFVVWIEGTRNSITFADQVTRKGKQRPPSDGSFLLSQPVPAPADPQ